MHRPSLLLVALASLAVAGCGGGGGGGSTATKSVTISAPVDRIQPGGTLALTALVEGGGTVVWSVDGGATNGTVTAGGVYTAPATQGTYTVRATVGGKSATKTITVFNGIAIALTANAAPPLTIPKSKLTFAAAVTGSPDSAVTWTATGGTFDGAVYTAPDAAGTYTVTGTSHADATKKVTATVQVAANVNVRVKWTDYAGASKGETLFALRPDVAPNTVANYVTLVNSGFYAGVRVHRYESGFVVQWGSPTSKTASLATLQDPNSTIGTSSEGPQIPFESTDGKLSFLRGVLGMASTSAMGPTQSQMFVTLADSTFLDPNYVAFGTVTSGMDVVDALRIGDTITSATTEAVTP